MAKFTSKMLNAVAVGANLEQYPGFRWKNKGSMVLIGDKTVSYSSKMRAHLCRQ